ncbi:MAG: enoyl-CoA hydratase/isomerase family protein [Novosphingobium sp.]
METLALETAGPVARLSLDRPDQRNAMSALLVAELGECLQQLEGDPQIRTIVLSGSGRGFCAGSDLSELAAMDAAGREAFEAESGRLARLIWNLETPVIAAVTGFAIGGGFTLATSCDIVVTAPDAKWSLPEVPIGLFPAWGIDSVVLRAGQARARRLCWGIDILDGQQAIEAGLADELADDPIAAAHELAQKLAALPPNPPQRSSATSLRPGRRRQATLRPIAISCNAATPPKPPPASSATARAGSHAADQRM